MTTLEICAVVVAGSSVIVAVTSVFGLVGAWRLRRRLEATSARADRALARVSRITTRLDGMVADARGLETRVNRVLQTLLDEIEPPLRMLAALITGTRTGLTSWITSSANGARQRATGGAHTGPQKGRSHEPEPES